MKTLNLKKQLGLFLSFLSFAGFAQSYGEIRGYVTNEGKEPVPFATVKILQGNLLVGGTQTDENGRYQFKPLDPGTYNIVVLESGHITQPINNIKVKPSDATYVDVTLKLNMLGVIDVVADPIDYTGTGVDITIFHTATVSGEELQRNSAATPGDMKSGLTSMSSDIVSTGNGEVHFRGARDGASGFFVDGVRTLNLNNVPALSIENVSVFTGGVPAMYGDLGSGVVMITTKSYFSAQRENNIKRAERSKE
ncbi:MAG: carboxypeptidase regulatory-like domain-containing protein [Bacteroidia bacterium]|nr:carboxypeptidase regulatory-like domain-containing protein [Bacteroidia bacterium]